MGAKVISIFQDLPNDKQPEQDGALAEIARRACENSWDRLDERDIEGEIE